MEQFDAIRQSQKRIVHVQSLHRSRQSDIQ